MDNVQHCKNFKIVGIGDLAARQLSHLADAGYQTTQLKNTSALQTLERSTETAVLLLDSELGELPQILSELQGELPNTPVIVLSNDRKPREVSESISSGAFWYLTSDCKVEDLQYVIARACVVHELSSMPAVSRAQAPALAVQPLVAKSQSMKETLERARVVAGLDTTVLLTGESGTGKTTLARFIHQSSFVSGGPFISVSCASIPRELLEAELFGHEKGAFTGAVSNRPGLVELADKGTLFLDEVGDLPIDLQPKILTFLQERAARRVGGRQQYRVDVRVIAATNRDLRELCQKQEFREDLYFRLNVISLVVPPLRSRKEDIAPLTSSILDSIARRRAAPGFRLSQSALAAACNYSWPGNVRELENVLERASIFAPGNTISETDLGLGRDHSIEQKHPINLAGFTIAELEEKLIRDTLKSTSGDKVLAAKMLGVSLKTIYNKITRYGIG